MPKHELYVSAPGYGKTFACIELFREEVLRSPSGIDSQCFFVLPNREHAGRIQHLLLKKDVAGLFNAHIITFHELTSRLLSGLIPPRPTKALRAHLVRTILQDPTMSWSYFDSVKDLRGFQELVAETIQEFKSSLLSIEEFEKRAQVLLKAPVFKQKFRDFSVLVKRYEEALSGMGLADEEDAIQELLSAEASPLDPKLIVMDGFYHFTRSQRRVIEYLIPRTDRMVITLTLPANASSRGNVFAYGETTRQFLLDNGFVEPLRPAYDKNHRTQDVALRHLEANIFVDDPKVHQITTDAVQIIAADHVHDEVEMIARHIRDCHRERNVHFSDIALILRSVGPYEKRIRAIFREYDIPFFIHERGKMIENSALLFVYHFLGSFSAEQDIHSFLALMGSSAVRLPMDEKELAEMQRRLLYGPVLTEQGALNLWISQQADLVVMTQRYQRLFQAKQNIAAAMTASDFRLRLEKELRELGWESSLGEYDLAAKKAFQELCKQWDGYGVSPQTMPDHLRRGIELGLFSEKPSGKNRVQVYDTVMALPKEYKIVFVAGLLEKQFPKEINEDAIFKDEERRKLNAQDRVLEERLPRAGGERFFFYMALTRAREQVYFSYPLKDIEGRPHTRSFFVDEVLKCFAQNTLKVHSSRDWRSSVEWVSPREAENGLARSLFAPQLSSMATDASVLGLAASWSDDMRFRGILEAGLASGDALLTDKAILPLLAQSSKVFSATRLESYLTCAFKYHGKYTLKLKEPLENRERIEMGKVLHEALEKFFRDKVRSGELRESLLKDKKSAFAQLKALLDDAFSRSGLASEPPYRRDMYHERLSQILSHFMGAEAARLSERDLDPSYFELGFGGRSSGEGGKLDHLEWSDIKIEGVIDRIDINAAEKKALIVDYKLSAKDLWKKIDKGLEVQLPLYIMAVEALMGLKVIGAELRFLQADGKDAVGMYLEGHEDSLGVASGKSVLEESDWKGIMSMTKRNILSAVQRMRAGDIRIHSKSCDFCPYDPVCRFEKWRLIYDEVDGG